MSINDLRPGQSAVVHTVMGNNGLSRRLQALGCIEGTQITVKTIAPLGDPIIINLRGFDLAIRKKDARSIQVKGA